jgi:hypothetical protein
MPEVWGKENVQQSHRGFEFHTWQEAINQATPKNSFGREHL